MVILSHEFRTLIRPPAQTLYPSPLPKDREQESIAPFSPGGLGMGAIQIHAGGLLNVYCPRHRYLTPSGQGFLNALSVPLYKISLY